MKFTGRTLAAAAMAMVVAYAPMTSPVAQARSAAKITAEGRAELQKLQTHVHKSRLFASHAKGILVFPHIIKAGLVIGGESGNGVLFINGRPSGFYNLSAGSIGLQAGAKSFGFVMFLMNDEALRYLQNSKGFSLGEGPSVVFIDKGAAMEGDTTTIAKDVYAFPFDQKGLMADLSLQGSKISHIYPH